MDTKSNKFSGYLATSQEEIYEISIVHNTVIIKISTISARYSKRTRKVFVCGKKSNYVNLIKT